MGLNERIDSLPPEMPVEVADFVEYLHQKRARQQLDESADKSLGKEIQKYTASALSPALPRPSLVEVLASAPGHHAFQSADEVDAYIRSERDVWED